MGAEPAGPQFGELLRQLQFCYSGVLNKQYFLSIHSILQTILFSSSMVVGRVGPPHPQICSKSSSPGPGNVISFENGIFADTIQLRCDCTGLGWALTPLPVPLHKGHSNTETQRAGHVTKQAETGELQLPAKEPGTASHSQNWKEGFFPRSRRECGPADTPWCLF